MPECELGPYYINYHHPDDVKAIKKATKRFKEVLKAMSLTMDLYKDTNNPADLKLLKMYNKIQKWVEKYGN